MARTDRLALAFQSRALTLPAAGTILVLRAALTPFLDLAPAERLVCEQTFRPVHDALGEGGRTVTVRAEGLAAMVVVMLTRSRGENLGNVARALELMPPGGTLVVTGAKSDGVDSLARQIGGALPVAGTFAKGHGRVVWLARPEPLPPVVADWARAAAPARNAAGFVTAPGMFSPERPDPGSRRLAEALPGRLVGRVADLGAGWGWLAQAALAANPGVTAIDLFEAEALALQAARSNVSDPRAGFHWTDATRLAPADRPADRYDAVISNPPFHQGRAAEPDLGAAFIAAAGRILKPDGRLLMVANRQLPYEETLATSFRHVEKLAEAGAYKVMLAARPQRA